MTQVEIDKKYLEFNTMLLTLYNAGVLDMSGSTEASNRLRHWRKREMAAAGIWVHSQGDSVRGVRPYAKTIP